MTLSNIRSFMVENICNFTLISFVSLLLIGTVFAKKNVHSGNKFVGHYSGTLDLSPIGNFRFENAQITLNADGTAMFATDEDGEEHETVLMGIWKKTGSKTLKLGVIGYRVGKQLCFNLFSPPEGRNDDRCTFKLAAELKLSKHGTLTGLVRPEIVEINEDTGEVFSAKIPASVPLVDFKRTKLRDFAFPSQIE